jgi:hypothetical protein
MRRQGGPEGWANLVGFGELVDPIWTVWAKENEEAARQAELQAVVQMAADEFRQQVEAVVREVAGGQPAEVRRQVSEYLQQLPEVLRLSFRREEERQGQCVPPGLQIR